MAWTAEQAASVLSFNLSYCLSPYKCVHFLESLFFIVGTRATKQAGSPPYLASVLEWLVALVLLSHLFPLLLAVPLIRAGGAALVPSLCRASSLGKWLSSLCRVARITTRHRRRRSSQCNDCAASGSVRQVHAASWDRTEEGT